MIKVLIVGETCLLCNIVKDLLEKEPNMEAVCVTSIDEAKAHLEENFRDLVLVHSEHGKKDALSTVQTLANTYRGLKIMVIDLPYEKEDILPYLESGASGYILCQDSAQDIIEKIIAVYKGKPIICPYIAAALIDRIAEWASRPYSFIERQKSLSDLTRREIEVLRLLENNLSNQEIADKLVLEVGTVKNHVHHILRKLNVHNRNAAAAYSAALPS
jgi:DNA-binding NarL/FixJ family response regulator